ncbi:MAG TPA: hypothetical protein PK760_10960 [Flavobacteriales bacterium]|nr:hypothetical protein [Flavobacteriales bacterium]
MAHHFLPDENGNTKRPDAINVLGLLTFVNTGLFIVIYGIGLLGMLAVQQMSLTDFQALFQEGAFTMMPEESRAMIDVIVPVLYYHGAALMGIYMMRTVLRLIGAIGIWRGKKKGFYLYAGAQLIGLFAPHIILPWQFLGFMGPLLTVAVTATYGRHIKRMI